MRQTAISPIFSCCWNWEYYASFILLLSTGNFSPVCRVRKKGFEPLKPPLKCLFFNFAFADCRQTPCKWFSEIQWYSSRDRVLCHCCTAVKHRAVCIYILKHRNWINPPNGSHLINCLFSDIKIISIACNHCWYLLILLFDSQQSRFSKICSRQGAIFIYIYNIYLYV